MKKQYFMIAAAATLFAACAETDLIDEVSVQEVPQVIGFETFANKQTRAEGETETPSATSLEAHHTSFTVWTSKKIGDAYKEVYSTEKPGTVEYAQQVWTATPLKYWDKTATSYHFYAASPVASENGVNWVYKNSTTDDFSTGYLTLADYTLRGTNLADGTTSNLKGTWKDNIGGDKDLMVAVPETVGRDFFVEAEPTNVQMSFIHILSKLNISVMKDQDEALEGVTITLNQLDVVGLKNKGTFSGTNLENNEGSTGGVITHWNTGTSETYTLSAGGTENGLILDSEVCTHEYLIMPQSQSNAVGIVNNANKPTNDAAYLYIKYTVSGTADDSEVFEAYYGLADVLNTTLFNEGWQNTLKITISPDVITFATEETPWEPTNRTTPEVTID